MDLVRGGDRISVSDRIRDSGRFSDSVSDRVRVRIGVSGCRFYLASLRRNGPAATTSGVQPEAKSLKFSI